MAAVKALTTAQGAGGMGPAHGQVPPKAPAAQGVQICGATNNLCWADTFCQRSNEDIREYFSQACAELGNHLKESTPLLYGETYTPVDLATNGDNTIARMRNRRAMGQDVGQDAVWCQEIAQCLREATARATRAAKGELEKYRKNYHTFLTSQAIMQGNTKDGARSYAAEQMEPGTGDGGRASPCRRENGRRSICLAFVSRK
jgi:hypothetical protein